MTGSLVPIPLNEARASLLAFADREAADNEGAPNPCPDYAAWLADLRPRIIAAADYAALAVCTRELAPLMDSVWRVSQMTPLLPLWLISPRGWYAVAAKVQRTANGYAMTVTKPALDRHPETLSGIDRDGFRTLTDAVRWFLTNTARDGLAVEGAGPELDHLRIEEADRIAFTLEHLNGDA